MDDGSESEAIVQIAGIPATLVPFRHAGTRLSLYQVAKLEDLVDRDSLLCDDVTPDPPYWAHLWIGAWALARFLAESADLDGEQVLDLGCGLGLPGLVAAARGAEVWFADREALALEFVRESARRNGFENIHCSTFDFTRSSLEQRFDRILGAELVYDPESYLPLCRFVAEHLRAGGRLHFTDAFRADATTFFTELARSGFAGEREARREWHEGRPHGLFLWTFRRPG